MADRQVPLVTAAYGTRAARPARTTTFARGGNGSQLAQRVRSVSVTSASWARAREGSRQLFGLRVVEESQLTQPRLVLP